MIDHIKESNGLAEALYQDIGPFISRYYDKGKYPIKWNPHRKRFENAGTQQQYSDPTTYLFDNCSALKEATVTKKM